MKHCHPVIILICALTFTNAMALDSSTITSNICTPAGECQGGPYIMTGCETVICTKYKLGSPSSIPGVEQITVEITSCDKCSDGYTRTSKSEQCGSSNILAYTCVENTCTCPTCPATITGKVSTGYIRTQYQNCNRRNEGCICEVTSTKYSCESEYYQSGDIDCQARQSTSTMTCSGCTKCPTNSTCNATGFTCKSGYYESGKECKACPTNSTTCDSATNFTCKNGFYKSESGKECTECPPNATCANNNITCNQNYYKSGSKCESCGEITIKDANNESKTITMVTDAAGATNKSACHLPDDDKNTTYNTKYNGHNVTVKLTGPCSKN